MPARKWQVLEHFMPLHTYITDPIWDVYPIGTFGQGATIERFILDWYAVSQVQPESAYDSQWQYSKIAVWFEDGGSEGEPPVLFNANLDWVFNDLLLWHPTSMSGADPPATRWHASSSGYLRSSQGQRKQVSDTGGLIWVGYGQYATGESGRNDLPFRMTYSLRVLIQPTV